MKLRSFGCSFIYGSDLSSPTNTWPSLIAERLGIEHVCHAAPGIGNLQIMESVLEQIEHNDIFLINWTWIDRFDFVNITNEKWETLRPALDHQHAEFYFRNMHSQYRDMLTNLIYIKTAIEGLTENSRKFLMTCVDDLLFEQVSPEWHTPTSVSYLQQKISPYIKNFEGKNFLCWSRENKFKESNSWHPLEDAHLAAAELWTPFVKDIIKHQ